MTTPVTTSQMPDGSMLARPVYLVDNSGTPISSSNGLQTQGGAGGTQYTDGGTPPTHPIGNALVFNNSGAWVAVSASNGLPITGSISATNPSVSSTGAGIPTSATMVGASDGTNLQQLLVESASQRNLRVGLFQAGNEAAVSGANALKVDGSAVTQPVSGTFWQATQPVSGTVTANAGTGPFPAAGMVASGASNANNPVKIGGVYNTTQPTVTTGQVVDAQATARGAQVVAPGVDNFGVQIQATAGTALGADQSNTELKVSLYGKQTAAGDTPVLVDSSGRVYVNVNSLPALAAGSANIGGVEIFDSGGTNKLAVDASGRLTLIPNASTNVAQLGGTTTSTNSGTIDGGTLRTVQGGAATGTKTSVAGSASSVTILASNTSRKGALIYNDSTALLYLDLSGGTASTSSYSVQVPSQGFFEAPGPAVYTGAITGIWASATGNARVTEFS